MLGLLWVLTDRSWRTALLLVCVCGWQSAAAQSPSDSLPSWNEGSAKSAIVEFVEAVTKPGGPDFVPPAERIATFDNDGTLWAEQPRYVQLAFALDRIKALALRHSEWRATQPFKAVLEGDPEAVAASGKPGLLEIMAATHAGMTTEQYGAIVADWLARARHPRFRRPYTELVYQPMLELLAYLRANGFKTFIVSGGGVEFMRVFAERVYGIPPEQVIGSSGVVRFEIGPDRKPVLVKEAKVEFVDDGPGKPVGINRFIGRRPIAAFGNSDGDLQMLQWTTAGQGRRVGLIVHHDDAMREYAYDRKSAVGRLDEALKAARPAHWVVVSMATDWRTIFPEATR